MSVTRGEIVEVNFPIPGGSKIHPTLVLSNDDVYDNEGFFIGAMLSSKTMIDEFSFELQDEMFSKIPKKKTQVKVPPASHNFWNWNNIRAWEHQSKHCQSDSK